MKSPILISNIKYGYVYLESYYSVYDSYMYFHCISYFQCSPMQLCRLFATYQLFPYLTSVVALKFTASLLMYHHVSINFIIFRPGYLLLIFERILCKYKPVNQKIYERQYPILPAPSDIRSPNESGSRLSPSRTRIIDITFRCFPNLL